MEVCEQPQLPKDSVAAVEEKLQTLLLTSPADFDAWALLVAETEKKSCDDIEKICLVYESFLSEFPLCYGYWKKYATHKARLTSTDKVIELYERAVQFASYSVDLWIDYCSFAMLLFEDLADVRRLFERGISYVGKDYRCHLLWDKYIEFEYSQKQWNSLAHIYIRTLEFPTRRLHRYFDSIKKLAVILEEEMESHSSTTGLQSDVVMNNEMSVNLPYKDEEVSIVIRDLLDPAIGSSRSKVLQRYLSTAKRFYEKSCLIDAKICGFENRIRRPYFHVKPLDNCQLENWHEYLDFIEIQEDFDWIVKLYERCLIPCANYPEFWMRYVELMENMGGREIASFALDRATKVFLKRVPQIHLFCARVKEKIGDALGAHAAFCRCDTDIDSEFIENVKREANTKKRMGNSEAALKIYEKALSKAKEKDKLETLATLYVEFSQFKYLITGNLDTARDILHKGIEHLPHCKLLIEEFIDFEMRHREPKNMNVIDSIVARAISPVPDVSKGMSNKDREDISSLYQKFVDQFGTIHDIMKAWKRHRMLFPYLLRPSSNNFTTIRQETFIALPHPATGCNESNGLVEASELDNKHQKLSQNEIVGLQPGHSVSVESPSEDTHVRKDTLETVKCPNVVENSEEDATGPSIETNSEVHMASNHCEAPEVAGDSEECLVEANKDHKMTHEPTTNLRPPSLENLSLNSEDNVTQVTSPDPPTSLSFECHLEASQSNDGAQHHEASYRSSETCMQLDSSLQSHDKSECYPSHMSESSNSPQKLPCTQSVPATIPCSSHAVSEGVRHQMNYVGQVTGGARNGFNGYLQTQPQQLHSSQSQDQSSPMSSQMHMGRGHPLQTQSLPPSQIQPGNQALNQYQGTATGVQQMSAHPWPVQNMQQHGSNHPSQPQTGLLPVSYPQGQVYQYPVQSNTQYGHMQANQGYGPYMWQYYYQQQPQQHVQQQPQQHLQQQQLAQHHLQQQQPQQHQQQQQLAAYFQYQSWNSNYHQQSAPVQQFGSSPYGQEYAFVTQSEGNPPIVESSLNSLHSYPPPNTPSS